MKKKGFTLIELLAVIVILAIIALIAVPVIINIISGARKSAFEDTAYGLISAGEMYYAESLLESGMASDLEFTITDGEFVGENKLEVKGSLPTNGKITVTKDGKVAIAISNGNYCITKATTESEIQTDESVGECTYRKVLNPIITTNAQCLKDETKKCTADDIKTDSGVEVQVKVNDKETKTFYVVKDDGNTLTLIMDRNIGEPVAWLSAEDYKLNGGMDLSNDGGACQYNNICASGVKGPITALKYLEIQTNGWVNIEVRDYQYIDSGYGTISRKNVRSKILTKAELEEIIQYSWACKNLNGITSKYWTSSLIEDDPYRSYIGEIGAIILDEMVTESMNAGVRPVIEIAKTII